MRTIRPGETIHFKFTTRDASGAPATLTGGSIEVYQDAVALGIGTGTVLTADFNSVVGLNHLAITTSSLSTFYAAGSTFRVVLDAGTVDSVSVVGEVVAEFELAIERPATWYVAASGGDDGGPGTIDAPLATYGEAETRAVFGDTIHFLAGTHSFGSGLFINKSGLILEGVGYSSGADESVISCATSDPTITAEGAVGITIRNLKITGNAANHAISIDECHNLIVEGCLIQNARIGIYLDNTMGVVLRRCQIEAVEHGVDLGGLEGYHIDSCWIATSGTYSSSSTIASALTLRNGVVAQVRNSRLSAVRATASSAGLYALLAGGHSTSKGQVYLEGCTLEARATHASNTGEAVAIADFDSDAYCATLVGCTTLAANAGSGSAAEIDASVSGSQVRVVASAVDSQNIVGAGNVVFLDDLMVSALKPTVVGRTLDVSATGEAGIDLANVGSPTTPLNLSGTTIAEISGNVGGRVLGGSATAFLGNGVRAETGTGEVIASANELGLFQDYFDNSMGLLQTHGDTTWSTGAEPGDAMTLTTGERTTLAGAIEAAIINEGDATAVLQAIADKIAGDLTVGDLSTQAIATAVWQFLTSAATTPGSVGKLLVDNVNATISSRASQTSVDDIPDTADFNARTLPSASYSTLTASQVNAEVDTALADYDGPTMAELNARTLLAADYATSTVADSIKAVSDKLNDTLEDDAGTFRFSTNALEQAPTGGSAPTAEEVAGQVRTELTPELGRIDATISSRATGTALTALQTHGDSSWATATGFATAGDAMTLTAGERTTLTQLIESALVVEGDGTALLQAIADKINADFSLGELTSATIAAAVWDKLLSGIVTPDTIGKLIVDNVNATIASRASQTSLDAVATNATSAANAVSANQSTLEDATHGNAAIKTLIDTSQASIDAVASDAAELNDTKLTTERASNLDNLDAQVSDVVGGGVVIPVNQVPVPSARTFVLKHRGGELLGEIPLERSVGTELLFAVDYRHDLATNGRLISVDSVTFTGTVGGITFGDTGVDRSQAKVMIAAIEAGTYEIDITVSYDDSDGGGTAPATVTLIVT